MKSRKVIVFDVDGVIIPGSESLKRYAWIQMGRDDLKLSQSIEQGRKETAGGDRFDILRAAGRSYRGNDTPSTFVEEKSRLFDAIVQAGMIEIGVSRATRKALKELTRRHTLYTNSATPERAIRETFDNLKLTEYFKGVFGRPFSKLKNLERIASMESVPPSALMFVGDQEKDFVAAQEFGCQFIGLTNDWNKWESDRPFPLIFFVRELLDMSEK